MILDHLDQACRYRALHPAFDRAFAFLEEADSGALSEGRHELGGPNGVYALVADGAGRGREVARLEAHRGVIDIQMVVAGTDLMGWRPVSDCKSAGGYDPDNDIEFFHDPPIAWLTVPRGCFAVFFPEDAHAPLAGQDPVRKIVVKVPLG
ncbi:MAG: DUF386 domain-containing protein [Kiritimatiellaeota bacterium]|nr:DUF386 domain-containing protein [Kiritimatiellota bacterium]